MRHRIYGKQLSRDSDHRRAMLRNLAAGLFEHGEIETTLPKAKAVQPFVEKIITIAKKGTFTARRQITARLTDRHIHAWVADDNVPDSRKDNPYFDLPDEGDIQFNRYGSLRKAPRLVQHVMKTVAPMFDDRDGGYTRIVKTGRRRLGDGTDLVVLQFVGQEEGPEIGAGTSQRRRKADKRTAFAAARRKGGDAAAAGSIEAAVAAEWSARLREATLENKRDAFAEIGRIVPEGQTEPTDAIRRGLGYRPDVLFLLSDGDFGEENQSIIRLIADKNRDKRTIVNTILFVDDSMGDGERVLRAIAEMNRGTYKHVTEEDILRR